MSTAPATDSPPRFVLLGEIRARYGIGLKTLNHLESQGLIRVLRLPACRARYSLSDVEALASACTGPAREPEPAVA